mmetsp:Transcript_14699/g.27638  ORF Transcript_14699/g.27638 Transcript_14699/m.27638 type:complete len:393 (-) Transcript_14699:1573-2751(-)|eukprot:CAMPEP_0176495420 /NCGR_PEP_ID=MMETSP0200_2-20121128/10640_1 /TAXON_ID=947934 /ORGANISM="Chaetoceros sp., Strain GSL56" /LENGTH=392 /DNA_ID=CAMNT_0017893283 /DNA_START=746 /DNA_END=1924 /DNA_ORIENTATION=-
MSTRRRGSPSNGDGSNETNPDSAARQRIELQPYILIPSRDGFYRRLREVGLRDILNRHDDLEEMDLSYVTLQLLKIIHKVGELGIARMRSRNSYRVNTSEVTYRRMFICRVFSMTSGVDSQQCVYLIQSNDKNKKLWSLDVDLRDNGVLAPGTIFRLLNIQPVHDTIGQVPCLESPDNAIILRAPDNYPNCPIDRTVTGDSMKAFTLNGAKLKVTAFNLLETGCAGAFCDKQRAYETAKSGCGCYMFEKNKQHMGIGVRLIVTSDDGDESFIVNFCSQKFMLLFMNDKIPHTETYAGLRTSEAFFEIRESCKAVVDFINRNKGWTVCGWYKRGVINDRTLAGNGDNDEENKIEGDITFHVVSLVPTDRNYLDHGLAEGLELKNMKFDVSTLG